MSEVAVLSVAGFPNEEPLPLDAWGNTISGNPQVQKSWTQIFIKALPSLDECKKAEGEVFL